MRLTMWKNEAGGITLCDFKLYYGTTGIRPGPHWHKTVPQTHGAELRACKYTQAPVVN